MGSRSSCLVATGLLRLARRFQDSSLWWRVTESPSCLRLNNIPLSARTSFVVPESADAHVGGFCLCLWRRVQRRTRAAGLCPRPCSALPRGTSPRVQPWDESMTVPFMEKSGLKKTRQNEILKENCEQQPECRYSREEKVQLGRGTAGASRRVSPAWRGSGPRSLSCAA